MEAGSKPAQLKMKPPPLNNLLNANNIAPVHSGVRGFAVISSLTRLVKISFDIGCGHMAANIRKACGISGEPIQRPGSFAQANDCDAAGLLSERYPRSAACITHAPACLQCRIELIGKRILAVAPCPITSAVAALPTPSCSPSSHGPLALPLLSKARRCVCAGIFQ